jgi:hypothetical protein
VIAFLAGLLFKSVAHARTAPLVPCANQNRPK